MTLSALRDWQSWEVVARQARIYLRNWYTGLLPPALEPLLYLLAFGLGLGSYIKTITWDGQQFPYLVYIAPGIITYTAFNAPFFQGIYGAFVRMHYQKTWEALLGTQVELRHVVAGEMLWAGLLGTAYAAIVCLVLLVFSWCQVLPMHCMALPLTLPLAFVLGCAMGLVGLFFTSVVPNIDHMNLPTFLVGFPVGLFSDTYFPIHSDRWWLQALIAANPVHHCAESMRGLLLNGRLDHHAIALVCICALVVLILFPLVVKLMARRVLGA
jgi:lipooligosaccharide transport system permease protein